MPIKDLLFGYYGTQILFTIVKLEIPTHLLPGPKSIDQLAALTNTIPEKLFRIMRYACALEIFEELPDKTFKNNEQTNCLLPNVEGSLINFIKMHAQYFYPAAAQLADSLSSSSSSFEVEFGMNAGKYFNQNSEPGAIYHSAMRNNTQHYTQLIIDTYDFSQHPFIVDVGGGAGSLLAAILQHNSQCRGLNFDLQTVEDHYNKFMADKAIAKRCNFAAGDFFKSVPENGDCYIMKTVLHGKSDQEAVLILNNCKKVLRESARLLIIERMIDDKNSDYINGLINDINMMNVTNGYVRTKSQFENIINNSNLQLLKIYHLQDALAILEVSLL